MALPISNNIEKSCRYGSEECVVCTALPFPWRWWISSHTTYSYTDILSVSGWQQPNEKHQFQEWRRYEVDSNHEPHKVSGEKKFRRKQKQEEKEKKKMNFSVVVVDGVCLRCEEKWLKMRLHLENDWIFIISLARITFACERLPVISRSFHPFPTFVGVTDERNAVYTISSLHSFNVILFEFVGCQRLLISHFFLLFCFAKTNW